MTSESLTVLNVFDIEDYEEQAGYEAGSIGYRLCRAVQKEGFQRIPCYDMDSIAVCEQF